MPVVAYVEIIATAYKPLNKSTNQIIENITVLKFSNIPPP